MGRRPSKDQHVSNSQIVNSPLYEARPAHAAKGPLSRTPVLHSRPVRGQRFRNRLRTIITNELNCEDVVGTHGVCASRGSGQDLEQVVLARDGVRRRGAGRWHVRPCSSDRWWFEEFPSNRSGHVRLCSSGPQRQSWGPLLMNPELFKDLAEQTLEANRVRMEMFNGKVWAHPNRTWPIPLPPASP